jgi:hypothetical protein
MSHITLKATEITGAVEIARLDCEEKSKQVKAHLEDLHSHADRGKHWHKNEKMLAKHSLKVARFKETLDTIEAMCKLSADGFISLGDNDFKVMKPFIRTL